MTSTSVSLLYDKKLPYFYSETYYSDVGMIIDSFLNIKYISGIIISYLPRKLPFDKELHVNTRMIYVACDMVAESTTNFRIGDMIVSEKTPTSQYWLVISSTFYSTSRGQRIPNKYFTTLYTVNEYIKDLPENIIEIINIILNFVLPPMFWDSFINPIYLEY